MLGNQKIRKFAMQIPKWLLAGVVVIISLYLATEILWSLGLGFSSVHKWGTSPAGISVKTTVLIGALFLALVTAICGPIQHHRTRRRNENVSSGNSGTTA